MTGALSGLRRPTLLVTADQFTGAADSLCTIRSGIESEVIAVEGMAPDAVRFSVIQRCGGIASHVVGVLRHRFLVGWVYTVRRLTEVVKLGFRGDRTDQLLIHQTVCQLATKPPVTVRVEAARPVPAVVGASPAGFDLSSESGSGAAHACAAALRKRPNRRTTICAGMTASRHGPNLTGFVLLLILLPVSQACGQEPGVRPSEGNRTKGMGGEVHCVNGSPVTEPPLPSLTGLARAENIRHEAMHASQFLVGCDSIMALWRDVPAYRLALEAQATCAGIQAYPDILERRYRKGLAAARIAQAYLASKGNTLGFEDVYDALDIWCSS